MKTIIIVAAAVVVIGVVVTVIVYFQGERGGHFVDSGSHEEIEVDYHTLDSSSVQVDGTSAAVEGTPPDGSKAEKKAVTQQQSRSASDSSLSTEQAQSDDDTVDPENADVVIGRFEPID